MRLISNFDNVLSQPMLITTAVGSSTYYNFINESVMIIQEARPARLHRRVRRRLHLQLKDGRSPPAGAFTDFDEPSTDAKGGRREITTYQHHGWALWYSGRTLPVQLLLNWFRSVAEAQQRSRLGFRQRKEPGRSCTMRGWEWIPTCRQPGGCTDFYYWLSTNVLTWRGTNAAARALEKAGHPEAARVRKEADSYRQDLVHGLELNRKYAPVVRLRDGRWVPHYPSHLYCRGRDYGWILQILEGAIYLLISRSVRCEIQTADWIQTTNRITCTIHRPMVT
jgi:hypothetical protein